MNRLTQLAIALTLAVCSHSANASLIIDTTGSQSGGIGIFGEYLLSTPATFGQTFTASGTNTTLSEFAFFVRESSAHSDNFDFTFHVAKWNGFRVDGPYVFSSSPMSTTDNGGAGGVEEVRFQINQELEAGQKYVALMTAEGNFDGEAGAVTLAIAGSGTSYSGGEFVYNTRRDDFDALANSNWYRDSGDNSSGYDTHFQIVFTPEPATFATWSCLAVALVSRRRKSLR